MCAKKIRRLLVVVGVLLPVYNTNASDQFSSLECKQLTNIFQAIQVPELFYEVDIKRLKIEPIAGKDSEGFSDLQVPVSTEGIKLLRNVKMLDSEREGLVALADYWGLTPKDFNGRVGYWAASTYAVENYELMNKLSCENPDKKQRFDIALFSEMVFEVFPAVGFSEVVLVQDIHKRFYIFSYKNLSDQFEVILKVHKAGTVHTVSIVGDDRLELKKYVLSLLKMNL